MTALRVLIACETSGVMRRAFSARGHDVWSCDLLPAKDGSNRHIRCRAPHRYLDQKRKRLASISVTDEWEWRRSSIRHLLGSHAWL